MDSADLTAANALYGTSAITALPTGFISDPDTIDSPIGYDGYVHNYSTNLYTVRFRTYDPQQGRWLERDPQALCGWHESLQLRVSSPNSVARSNSN